MESVLKREVSPFSTRWQSCSRRRQPGATMAIRFFCPECQQPQQVSDSLAGMDRRCPNCSVVVAVPRSSDPRLPGVDLSADKRRPGAPQGNSSRWRILSILTKVTFCLSVVLLGVTIVRALNQPDSLTDE